MQFCLVHLYWVMGWSFQGGSWDNFSLVAVSMGQPQALKKPVRFIPTVWENVSAYRFIFVSLSSGKLLMWWYAAKTSLKASQPNLSWSYREGRYDNNSNYLLSFMLGAIISWPKHHNLLRFNVSFTRSVQVYMELSPIHPNQTILIEGKVHVRDLISFERYHLVISDIMLV